MLGGETPAGEESQVSYKVRSGASWKRGDSDAFVVELQPMEIRTFLLTAETSKAQQLQGPRPAAAS